MILTKNRVQNFFLVILSIFLTFLILVLFIRFILGDNPRNELDFDLKDQPISFIEDEVLGWKPKAGKYIFKPWGKSGKKREKSKIFKEKKGENMKKVEKNKKYG